MLLQRERPAAPCAGFLPQPSPLPSLPAALSRRAAIFGAMASTGALAVAAGALSSEETPGGVSKSGDTLVEADRRLAAMAADLCETLDGAAYVFDPVTDEEEQNRRLGRGNALQLEIAALPAVGLAGVLAKAKAYLDSNSYDTLNLAELADSLAEDVERVLEGRMT